MRHYRAFSCELYLHLYLVVGRQQRLYARSVHSIPNSESVAMIVMVSSSTMIDRSTLQQCGRHLDYKKVFLKQNKNI